MAVDTVSSGEPRSWAAQPTWLESSRASREALLLQFLLKSAAIQYFSLMKPWENKGLDTSDWR